jgi:hypothetical protein
MSKIIGRGGIVKRAFIAITALMVSAGAFALDTSAGLSLSGGVFVKQMTTSISALSVSSDLVDSSLPFHAEVFWDEQYFRVGAGYRLRVFGHQKQTLTISGTTTLLTEADTGTKGYAAFTFYLKYPFAVGQFVLFPLLGFETDLNLSILDAAGTDLRASLTDQQRANESEVWAKAGMGAQLDLSDWGYIRAQLVLGWKLPNPAENDFVANAKIAAFDASLFFALESDLGISVGFKL